MFRAIALPILEALDCAIQLVVQCTRYVPGRRSGSGGHHRPATYRVHYTTSCIAQSNAPDDGQNNCPKHVELIGIINKHLLLHLVGCLLYYAGSCVTQIIVS
jgi:hypothetical protein